MKIDIWSDIRCPFCFIGKRKFEFALEKFPNKDDVAVEWHSFQLDPGQITQPDVHAYDYLAKVKGITREEVVKMHDYVNQAGTEAGIDFNFDKVVVANSLNGHRIIQLAKTMGLGDRAEEEFFLAHFTLGKNIDDVQALANIGGRIGLTADQVTQALTSDEWLEKVRSDERQARALGIRGVPFFIFNDKFAVSGAQGVEVFSQAIEKAWEEAVAASQKK